VGNFGNEALVIRQRSQVRIYNSIFTDFNGRAAVGGTNAAPDLAFNYFWNVVGGGGSLYGTSFVPTALNPLNSTNPQLNAVSYTNLALLDPRIASTSPARAFYRTPPEDGFYVPATHAGAFDSVIWMQDWTALSANAFLRGVFPDAEAKLLPTVPVNIVRLNPSTIRVSWPTDAALLYQVQTRATLDDPWTNSGAPTRGTGGTMSLDYSGPASQNFYRVQAYRP
jgi:hypothetical protein